MAAIIITLVILLGSLLAGNKKIPAAHDQEDNRDEMQSIDLLGKDTQSPTGCNMLMKKSCTKI